MMHTLPSLSKEEVSTIWGNVSEFVERQLSLHKGVQIPGLGTFTFTRQKLEVGNNKFILIQRPIFIMVEKLVQTHGLRQNKVYTPGDIPVVPLNFVMISLEGPFNRDTVERCVKETSLFLSRSISTKQNVEFTFKGIGVLVIRGGNVKMRFYKNFLFTMDGSGALAKALANRPDTVDSVLSSRESLGKRPDSMLSFPRIELKEMENKLPMETTAEEGGQNGQRKSKLKDQSDKEEGVREILSPKVIQDRQAISPTKATNVSFPYKLEQNGSGGKNMNIERLRSLGGLKNDNEMKPKISPATSCQYHNRTGQEMCYVCLQRAQRNSPLYYGEERKRREMEDELLLQQYQMLKDQESVFKEQMQSLASREQNQKNAAYNLGVAEAVRIHKNEKPEFHKSFLFDKRPLSPEINALKQEEYSQSLLKQMCHRREKDIKQRQNREMMDRLEQVQLTEDMKGMGLLRLVHALPSIMNGISDSSVLSRHLADRNAELERVSRIYQDLQDDWERSAVLKKQRDLEEKAFQRAPSKLFLLDQCEKYRRCKQCQRRPSNVGKSNVWPLNKYMQGSLLFV
ncbi:coiled-coil domain-containing protein 81 [Globicephala melas]|uniref:coiled-coil domain-containing protein 81 n=1 Tax=Globicephala melas TaxID=9731 RepID=UPI00293D46E5|nr:coiled-coil domain-containing protein 81 [Globicephala melas]